MSNFREMRRKRQELTPKECERILKHNSAGVLSVIGDNGYPYGVPLSYVYDNNAIYFHCAREGHKIDAIRHEPKVSFCVIDQDEVTPEHFTTLYRSVICFGQAEILESHTLTLQAIDLLARKYSPGVGKDKLKKEIEDAIDRIYIIKISVEHISGKQSSELL